MSTPTDGELRALVDGPEGMPRLARLWLKPVEGLMPTLVSTRDKPIGQYTMTELLSWFVVLGYFATSGMLAGALAGNVLRVAVRGR